MGQTKFIKLKKLESHKVIGQRKEGKTDTMRKQERERETEKVRERERERERERKKSVVSVFREKF